MMKKHILSAALLVFLSLTPAACSPASVSQAAPASPSENGSSSQEEAIRLGDFSAETLDGETVDQTVFEGHKLTVVNVWATFCGPCKTELPVLGALAREMEGEVQFIGIITDVLDQNGKPDPEQLSLAAEILEESEVEYQNLILNESLAQLGFASLSGVPATLILDAGGYLVGKGFYGSQDEEGWRKIIAERLEMAENE